MHALDHVVDLRLPIAHLVSQKCLNYVSSPCLAVSIELV
jgi:hypothetical protein